MAASRFFSNTAVQTALSGNISSGATSISVSAVTGFPALPYTLALDYGGAAEELVSVTAAASTTLTVTRGYGGTSAQSHSIGAVVRHVYDATEAAAFRTHEGATAAIHGVTGTLVGTNDVQTLGNKTLTAPAITAPVITGGGSLAGTFTGSPTFSGAVALSGGGSLAGTFTGTPTWSGSPTFTGGALFSRTLVTDTALRTSIAGDTNNRLLAQADGKLFWSDGAAAVDVNLYRQAAATLRTDNSLQVGGSLTVTGVGGVLRARKTADTSIVSSTTLTTDTMLTIPVVANAIYELEGGLFYSSASQAPDINVTVSGPAGVGGFWCTTGPNTTATTDPPNDTATAGSGNRTIASGMGVARSYGVSTPGSIYGLNITGMVEISATAGNVTIDWAQASSNATATTLKQYSWLRLTRVA